MISGSANITLLCVLPQRETLKSLAALRCSRLPLKCFGGERPLQTSEYVNSRQSMLAFAMK